MEAARPDGEGMSASTPEFAAIEHAEALAVRAALQRGFLRADDLREALLLREQLRLANRPTRLLQLLGRYIAEEHQVELRGLYFAALAEAREPGGASAAPAPHSAPLAPARPEPPLAPPDDMLFSSDDELAIPEMLLKQSSELLQRPPEEDPAPVREFMARSGEGAGPAPGPSQSADERQVTESGLWRWLKRQLPGKGEA